MPKTGLSTTDAARKCAALFKCKELIRKRLSKRIFHTFKNLAGLSLQVHWHQLNDILDPNDSKLRCPTSLRRSEKSGQHAEMCFQCEKAYWQCHLQTSKKEHAFTGQCGKLNFWTTLQFDGIKPLTLILESEFSKELKGRGTDDDDGTPIQVSCLHGPVDKLSSFAEEGFENAISLLRLILHDLQATVQAEFAQHELKFVRLQMEPLIVENRQLQRELHRRAPRISEKTTPNGTGNHSERIVQQMLDYLHSHYHRPMQLADVARDLNMNASYLSDLFSQTVGITFHDYLGELRLTKAKELLDDPKMRACEVASAVGYASASHFWRTFKQHTGLSPCSWRKVESPHRCLAATVQNDPK